MTLYTVPTSPNGIKVRAALDYLQIEADLKSVNPLAGENKTLAFLALNPNGRLPVLVHGDFVLWESNAILQYLGNQRPQNGFWPQEPQAQADVSRWMCWQLAHWTPAISPLLYENLARRSLGRGEPDSQAVAKAEEEFHRCARALQPALHERAFLCGHRVTAADFAVAPLLIYADLAKVPWRQYPVIVAWYQRVADLPAWRAATGA
ncbi:glutathione S-transferase family protein [bacterium]|nr:glutathione S-transferase family protein [bacterium]